MTPMAAKKKAEFTKSHYLAALALSLRTEPNRRILWGQ